MQGRPRRSVLYMPGSNERALEKAKTIPADAFIFDLEDAVAPDAKLLARASRSAPRSRAAAMAAARSSSASTRSRRRGAPTICSPPAMPSPTPSSCRRWCIPATSSASPRSCKACMPPEKIRLWAMMETPMAILNARTIAATAVYAENRLCCLVMGTNDLIKESRARALHDRFAVVPWLAMTLVAARAYRLDIIDGVYNDFRDEMGLREECERGRTLGMDGKTLIHPEPGRAVQRDLLADARGGRLVAQGDRRLRPAREREEGRDRGRGAHGRAAAFRHGPAHRRHRRADPRDGARLRLKPRRVPGLAPASSPTP